MIFKQIEELFSRPASKEELLDAFQAYSAKQDKLQFISYVLERCGGSASHEFLLIISEFFLSLSVKDIKEIISIMKHNRRFGIDSLITFYAFHTKLNQEALDFLQDWPEDTESTLRYFGNEEDRIAYRKAQKRLYKSVALTSDEINFINSFHTLPKMSKSIDIKISYLGMGNQSFSEDYQDTDLFLDEIEKEYLIHIKREMGYRGGGIYEFFIHILADVTLKDLITNTFLYGVTGGLATDLVKKGMNLSLKPFFDAYKTLKRKNKQQQHLDISSIKFECRDALVVLYGIFNESLPTMISEITEALIKHYDVISEYNDKQVKEIHLPIVRYQQSDSDIPQSMQSSYKFGYPSHLGQAIEKPTKEDYFNYWGLKYKFQHSKCIFDVKNERLFEEDWLDQTDLHY
ncbi:MAG: hypothetical protein ACFB0B_09870 [Thermonemataceae bacterium]